MDISNLATQENSDSGLWFPVELYGKSADFDLLILGDDSDIVQQHSRKKMKKFKNLAIKEKTNKDDEFDDETIDEMLESGDEDILVRIAGIRGWKVERKGSKIISKEPEPVTFGEKVLSNDRESFKFLISKMPAIKDFVLSKARDRTNFLSQQSGN
jgi:hypothetical protein